MQLATDIYRDAATSNGPVVLMRTPYNKNGGKVAAERFAAAGYIAMTRTIEATLRRKETFIPYNDEGQDGYDAIEWTGKQSWCNGRIGMWGSSYVGATQWQAAIQHPPGLTTITPTATFTSFYRDLYLGGGAGIADCKVGIWKFAET